jgi:hypothetical protein
MFTFVVGRIPESDRLAVLEAIHDAGSGMR